MRKMMTSLFIIILLIGPASFAQSAFTVDQLYFKLMFARKNGEPNNTYCLLGTGGILAMRTKDSDSVVSSWIKNHPHAQVIKVTEASPARQDGTGALIYIWLIDGKENLNISLIRQGVFQAGVMYDSVDLSKVWKDAQPKSSQTTEHTRRLVGDDQYQEFIKKVEEAEKLAKAEKKGIWSDEYKEEREYDGIK